MGIGRAFLGVLVLATSGGFMAIGAEPDNGRRDVHSFGNPQAVRVTHVGLDLDVDFARKVLRGVAMLDIVRSSLRFPADVSALIRRHQRASYPRDSTPWSKQ